MKKLSIFKIFLCFAILILATCMSACTDDNVKFLLDMDTKQLTINVPTDKLSDDVESKVSEYESIRFEKGKTSSDIVLDLSDQSGEAESQNEIMNVVASLLPEYSHYLNGLFISVEKNFFGTSLFGSEYFSFLIKSPLKVSVPLEIVFSENFLFNGNESVLDKSRGKYVLSTRLDLESDKNQFEMQYNTCNYKSVNIEIDITDDSPMVLYHISYDTKEAESIKNQLTAIGMTVEYCDGARATFSETFETCDDFKHVFPIRTFTLFDAVTTVDYQFSSFFSDKCNVTFIFKDMNNENVSLVIKSQEKTEFMLIQNGNRTDSKGDSINVNLHGDVEIHAEYDNARWFESTTSILTIVVIVLVLLALIYLVKKKF